MRIEINKFGNILTSRQSGKEAYSAFLPTMKDIRKDEELLLDFQGVNVLSPSWADEFLTPLLTTFNSRLRLTSVDNSSIQLTLETLEGILGRKFTITPS